MKDNLRAKISQYINGDHCFMTLAAYETLPDKMYELIHDEIGLLIRWFCELPDFYWELFGTLGEWEIDNHFCFDWRRNLKASYFLGANPVTGLGKRYGHNKPGTFHEGPTLLQNAVQALLNGDLRKGLAYTGAAIHFVQDVMTFPEQQSVHRREMSKFEDILISDYRPKKLFSSLDNIEKAILNIFNGKPDQLMFKSATEIRKCMRSGNTVKRREIQLQCDKFSAQMTADILYSALLFYSPSESPFLNIQMNFSNIDEERLPDGYFIDRNNSTVFQGYISIEGHLRRGYDKRKTKGLQLRFSATGNTEVRWKQSIIDAQRIQQDVEYEFNYEVYCINVTGNNGCRLIFYNNLWEPCKTMELTVNQSNGWYKGERLFSSPPSAIAVSVDFYSKNNTGTFLIDNWVLQDSRCAAPSFIQKNESKERLILIPGNDFTLCDKSAFSNQNEPIISVIGGAAGKISKDDEFIFDGKSHFIEIPYHPVYRPLQPEDGLLICFEFCPADTNQGELIMSANTESDPLQGWRLAQENGCLVLYMYGAGQVFRKATCTGSISMNTWHAVLLQMTPKGRILIKINDEIIEGAAPFDREYSSKGHYIGADHGICNFYQGRMKNLVMSESNIDHE